MTVMTDKYPEENSWTLTNTCTGQGWASPNFDAVETKFETSICATALAKYTFAMSDSFGDGKFVCFSIEIFMPARKYTHRLPLLPSIF